MAAKIVIMPDGFRWRWEVRDVVTDVLLHSDYAATENEAWQMAKVWRDTH